MIDGGTKLDKQHVSQKIKENGEEVEYWFITHAHDDHYGALNEILKENDDIKINNIIATIIETNITLAIVPTIFPLRSTSL